MHTVFDLLCFVVVIHWLIFPYPSGLLHWHCGNLTIAPVPAKQPWWIWINTSCEFIMNDCVTTTKQSTTKPCAYFLGYTVVCQGWQYIGRYLVSLKSDRRVSVISILYGLVNSLKPSDAYMRRYNHHWSNLLLLVCWIRLWPALVLGSFNTMSPRYKGRYFSDNILKLFFLNENAAFSIKS